MKTTRVDDDIEEREPNIAAPLVFTRGKPTACMTCANANGLPPFADSPMKSYCMVYTREDGQQKPSSVYYDGGDCEFYRGE